MSCPTVYIPPFLVTYTTQHESFSHLHAHPPISHNPLHLDLHPSPLPFQPNQRSQRRSRCRPPPTRQTRRRSELSTGWISTRYSHTLESDSERWTECAEWVGGPGDTQGGGEQVQGGDDEREGWTGEELGEFHDEASSSYSELLHSALSQCPVAQREILFQHPAYLTPPSIERFDFTEQR